MLANWLAKILFMSLFFNLSNACADFLLFLKSGPGQSSINKTRLWAANLTGQLEFHANLDRLAVAEEKSKSIDFDKLHNGQKVTSYLETWAPDDSTTSTSLEQGILDGVNSAIPLRRSGKPLVIVIVDPEGGSSFSTDPELFGAVSQRLKSKHYAWLLIASEKADRIRIALNVSDASTRLATSLDALATAAKQLARCDKQFSLNNELRRRPVPRLDIEANATSSTLTSKLRSVERKPKKTTTTTKVPTTTATAEPTTTRRPTKPNCQFDILLLVDASANSADRIPLYQKLMSKLVEKAEIGADASQVGLTRFAGIGRDETLIKLPNNNKTQLLDSISKIGPLSGTRRIAASLKLATAQFADDRRGAHAERYIVLFTDGYSRDDPTEALKSLQGNNIRLYVIAIEDPKRNIQPDLDQLKPLAGRSTDLITSAEDFEQVAKALAPTKCRY